MLVKMHTWHAATASITSRRPSKDSRADRPNQTAHRPVEVLKPFCLIWDLHLDLEKGLDPDDEDGKSLRLYQAQPMTSSFAVLCT